jgi:hypothetical protein
MSHCTRRVWISNPFPILTNAEYTKPVIQNALNRGYAHAHNIATEYADQDWGYHYCFGDGYKPYAGAPFEKAIDHIVVTDDMVGLVKRFERYSPDYYFPISDHSPAFIDLEL